MELNIVQMGTVYFDGEPQKVGAQYRFQQLSVGKTVPGKEIQWVRLKNGLLISRCCACKDISWNSLQKNGVITGELVELNGELYLCRCLQAGDEKGAPNEWDSALDEVGESQEIWYWKNIYFWGQERSKRSPACGVVRGGYSTARRWTTCSASAQGTDVGWRPVLEPLSPAPSDYQGLVGTQVIAIGEDKESVSGLLVSYTDYDLVMDNISPAAATCAWMVQDGNHVVVDRAGVRWLRKASSP